MSRIFICLFGLCILSIAIQFGDCENTQPDICADENIKPGSDKTRLALYEKALDVPKKIGDKIGNIWDKLRGKERNSQFVETQESIESQDQSTHQTVNKYINTIFPGTKWCGDGDIAKDENDLGRHNDTDACCREHDNCKSNIIAGKTKANLINNGRFTRSACSCDDKFRTCLKKVNSIPSREVTMMYFTILKPECFECVCPTGNCDVKEDNCEGKCKKYIWRDSRILS